MAVKNLFKISSKIFGAKETEKGLRFGYLHNAVQISDDESHRGRVLTERSNDLYTGS